MRTPVMIVCLLVFKLFAAAQTDSTLEVRIWPHESFLSEAEGFASDLEMADEDTCYFILTTTLEEYTQLQHDVMTTGFFIGITTSEYNAPTQPSPQRKPPPGPTTRYFLFDNYHGTLHEINRDDIVEGVQYVEIKNYGTKEQASKRFVILP